MIAFEKWLIDVKKYKKYRHVFYNKKESKHIYEFTDRDLVSSMGDLSYSYFLDENCKDTNYKGIIIGLNEYQYPPTLLFPRPKIKVIKEDDDLHLKYKSNIDEYSKDIYINYVLNTCSFDEIFERIFDKSKIYIIKENNNKELKIINT